MKSYAQVKGHPIHPALIPFPIAFLIGACACDLVGWWFERRAWTVTAMHLLQGGLAFGVLAAIPGVLDFWKRVPPSSSGHDRALRHGLTNAGALVVFATALGLHYRGGVVIPILVLECVGTAALLYAGWLGGVLVDRNMIGVDHRHANAGKWSESRFEAPRGKPLVVAGDDELEPGQMKLLIVNGRRLALARTPDGYAAFDDRCSHKGGPLSDGVCIGTTVQCLWHGSRFDVTTGAVVCGPAKRKIATHEVKVEKGRVTLVSAPG